MPSGLPYLAVVVANCFPLVGVLAFDWSVVAVLVLYWVEMGVGALWALPRALLTVPRDTALHGSNLPFRELRKKRGGPPLWPGGPTAYVRNVPVALQQVVFLALFWLVLGVFFALALDVPAALTPGVTRTVAVGALGITVAHGVEFVRTYVGEREYAETTDRQVVAPTARQGVFFAVLLFVTAGSEGFRSTGIVVVALVVAAKIAVETHARFLADGDGTIARLLARFGPGDTTAPAPAVPLPDGDPDAVVRPDRRGVLVGCVLRALVSLVNRPALIVALVGVLLFLVDPVLVLVPVCLLLVGFLTGAAVSYLLRGTVEYRRYGDVLVGYDRLIGEPQWRAPLDDVDASVRYGALGRHLGVATVGLDWRDPDESPWGSVNYEAERTNATVGPLSEPERDVRALDLRVARPTPPERDLTLAAAVLALAAVIVGVPSALAVLSGNPAAFIFLPFLAMVALPLCWVAVRRV
ncbi:DUF6498-containing protein [Halarchaeum sp. P4]|uniref:DUF6498-containing protein n=1 Tax=Halarchaeum sp. P4 TaxID=3421639 RepID=UPI003EB6B78D